MRINFFTKGNFRKLLTLIFLLFNFASMGQTIMFDDFNYSSVDDGQLSAFNKWNVISGVSGPPEGATYSRSNVAFINDPSNANNKLMTLRTTVNGSTKAITNARVETGGYEYFEGTYAARVHFSDVPFTYKDANIQTFYTIVSSALAQDGTKYSELDVAEYMAADKWGISTNNPVLYTTSYHKYIANPWKPWKVYNASTGSKAGWHTFVATCTDKVNVRYYMDGNLIATHSVTDSETEAGLPVYPRSNMQVAFANWIWNNVLGTSTANRNTTLQVDWTVYFKNQNLTPAQVNTQVSTFKSQGLLRRNLAGQTVYSTTPPPQTGIVSGGTYSVINVYSNKAMEVAGLSMVNGGNVQQWDYVGATQQKWRVTDVGGGAFNIVNVRSGKALDVANVSTADGANIHQWDYVGGANQKWQIIANGDGTYRIISVHSGKSAEVGGFSTVNGGNIQQWAYVGGNQQKWRFSAVSATRMGVGEEEAAESEDLQKVKIYPNPSPGNVTIEVEGEATVSISNNSGLQLFNGIVKGSKKIENLSTGFYLVVIKTADGVTTKKLLVK